MDTKERDIQIIAAMEFFIPNPSPFPFIRIGPAQDGGYLIPNDLEGITACFSPGVSNRKDFEDQLTKDHNIKCHLCDLSSDESKLKTPLIAGKQTFIKKWLEPATSDTTICLEDWVNQYEANTGDLLLQMDIEGAEYRNIISTPIETLKRFRIIVLELHGLDHKQVEKLKPTVEKLKENFICIHAHPNNTTAEFFIEGDEKNFTGVFEVTLLRKDRTENKRVFFQPELPHPLDIDANVCNKPPIFLNEAWLGKPHSLPSQIKMLQGQLAFERELVKREQWERKNVIVNYNNAFNNLSLLNNKSYIEKELEESVDLAKNKKFFLSSAPNKNGKIIHQGEVIENNPFFFETTRGRDQFITIEIIPEDEILHQPSNKVLEITNCTGKATGSKENGRCLFFIVHSEKKPDFKKALPLIIPDSFWSHGAKSVTPILPPLEKYFTIYSPETTELHFSSIKLLTPGEKHKTL